ncbi:hypothetical protein ACFLRC_02300 [Candidatus Altiarchaeota archaeon]
MAVEGSRGVRFGGRVDPQFAHLVITGKSDEEVLAAGKEAVSQYEVWGTALPSAEANKPDSSVEFLDNLSITAGKSLRPREVLELRSRLRGQEDTPVELGGQVIRTENTTIGLFATLLDDPRFTGRFSHEQPRLDTDYIPSLMEEQA